MFAKILDALKKADYSHLLALALGAKGASVAAVAFKVVVAAVGAAIAAGAGQ